MLIFYDIVYILFALCYLPFFLIKRKWHRGFLMRFGVFPQGVIDKLKGQKVIWLHTVSVGEVNAASYLVANLKREYPDYCLVISTVTKTGNKLAQRLVGVNDVAIYFPLDVGAIVKKVIAVLNPRLFVVAETELWPNLIDNLAKKDIPLILVNGRVSSGSFRGYRIIRPFLKVILQGFHLFCMQTKEDADRLIELGAPSQRVKVTGNMKFDLQLSAISYQLSDLGLSANAQLFIAGSTHRGEEKITLQVYRQLLKAHPDLRLLIAPRHIERVKEIEKLIGKSGFKSLRISRLNLNGHRTTNTEQRILILDTIGQLKYLYALADIVFIGGSLVRRGGQNPIEPAIFSKAVLFGPYMENFSNVARSFLDRGAAIMVQDAEELKNSCRRLLSEPGLRAELGRMASNLVEENRGVSLRNLAAIKELLEH